jgi:sodium/bile acid cotransporter 7
MVLIGFIHTGQRLAGQPWLTALGTVLLTVLAVSGIHGAAFFLGEFAAGRFGKTPRDSVAVGFSGSQKTLMVGLEVCAQLGVSIVPMVSFHVTQLVIDTMLADRRARWRKQP